MKNCILINSFYLLLMVLCLTVPFSVNGQCYWKGILYDGFEYTTVIPDLVTGTTTHNTPQAYAVHSGSKSAYFNFQNTTMPGTLIYHRTMIVCPKVQVRFSAWLCTSFSGVQCNVRVRVVDGNNNVLSNVDTLKPAYAPTWTQYQTGPILPMTNTITFELYTNIQGSQGGNDMSMDDLFLEQCGPLDLGPDTTICNNASITLQAGNNFSSYLWNDNSTNPTLLASTSLPGTSTSTYFVTVADTGSCVFRDTIKVTFAICSGIEDNNLSDEFQLYPFPSNNFINISTRHEIFFVQLFNLEGKLIQTFSGNNNFYVGNLPAGFYAMRIITQSGLVGMRKVLIE